MLGSGQGLDFSLEKIAGAASTADLTQSPTMLANQTSAGAVLGTASYMSPEQAQVGHESRRRSPACRRARRSMQIAR